MNKSKIVFREKLNILLLFLLIYFTSSFFAVNFNGTAILLLQFIIGVICVINNYKFLKLNIKSIIIVSIIFLSSAITMIINSETLYEYIIFWSAIIVAYLFYISFDYKKFINYFIIIMKYLSIFSLVTFLIQFIFPSILEFFPIIENVSGVLVYNLFFSVLYKTDYIRMNPGIFWEPGAYQTFLLIAMFFSLFTRNINKTNIVIFTITIFTTLSTAAYLGLFLLLFIYGLYRFGSIKTIIYAAVSLGVFLIIYDLLPANVQFRLFGKLAGLFDLTSRDNPIFESTTARLDGILIPLKATLLNPFIGVGLKNLPLYANQNGFGLLTATQFNWFGYFGIFIGVLLNLPLILWSGFIRNQSFIIKLLLFMFLNTIILSENYNRNAFYLLFLLISLDIKNNEQRDLI